MDSSPGVGRRILSYSEYEIETPRTGQLKEETMYEAQHQSCSSTIKRLTSSTQPHVIN